MKKVKISFNPTVYVGAVQKVSYKSLNSARRAFVARTIKSSQPVALIREAGLDFEVTYSEADKLVCHKFPNLKEATTFLLSSFMTRGNNEH